MSILQKLFSLKNKHFIVAGGSGQIGFVISKAISEAGALVSIVDIDHELGLEKLKSYKNQKVKLYKMNVCSKSDIVSKLKNIRDERGKIAGLVNCFHFKGNSRKLDPGSSFFTDFEKYSEDSWDLVHDVNLKGAFLMCQAIIPYLKESKSGTIINISSTYGIVSPNKNIYGNSGINSPISYATSKAAIIQLTRYLATHLTDYNIRVNALTPGGVENEQSQEFIENYCKLTPLKRMAKPEDYQGGIIFLLSDSSSYMTGSNLIIDGGWTAW